MTNKDEEYIEKRYLIEEFIERADAWEDAAAKVDNNLEYKGIARAYRNACSIIAFMHSANVRENIPVRLTIESNLGPKCPNCNFIFTQAFYHFCPWCGAEILGIDFGKWKEVKGGEDI